MAKIKINCGGLQMQVGGLDGSMAVSRPKSPTDTAKRERSISPCDDRVNAKKSRTEPKGIACPMGGVGNMVANQSVSLTIPSETFEKLKKISYYFDNDMILNSPTLTKEENHFLYYAPEDACANLRFVIDNLEHFEKNNFESESDRIKFIYCLMKFDPKGDIKKTAINYLSNSIPKMIKKYIDLIPSLGQEKVDSAFSESFSYIKTILQHPDMINPVFNQMDFSSCSENTITIMTTLFFSDLDEINLAHAHLSQDQFMALVSGINTSKEAHESAPPNKKNYARKWRYL